MGKKKPSIKWLMIFIFVQLVHSLVHSLMHSTMVVAVFLLCAGDERMNKTNKFPVLFDLLN